MGMHYLNHPLINHKLTMMRDIHTKPKDFKSNLDEIAKLMAYIVCEDLETVDVEIETPLEKMVGMRLKKEVVIVPILRAGLGFLDGLRNVIPEASVGYIGMARNEETLLPEEYYAKFPKDLDQKTVIVVDPMLATAGSGSAALNNIKARGAKDIKFMCLVAAPEGVKVMEKAHPDVDFYIAALDDHLNEKGYIVPGLGDAGDRLFGTE